MFFCLNIDATSIFLLANVRNVGISMVNVGM